MVNVVLRARELHQLIIFLELIQTDYAFFVIGYRQLGFCRLLHFFEVTNTFFDRVCPCQVRPVKVIWIVIREFLKISSVLFVLSLAVIPYSENNSTKTASKERDYHKIYEKIVSVDNDVEVVENRW